MGHVQRRAPAAGLALLLLAAVAGAQQDPEAPAAGQPPAGPAAAAPAPPAGAARPSPGEAWTPPPAVVRFYELLPAVLDRELEVQRFELKALRAEPAPEGGHRARRLRRAEDDEAHFRTRASQIALRPRPLPTPQDMVAVAGEGRTFNALELTALSAVETVYPHVAEPRSLEVLDELNRAFLREVNWSRRDDAVRLRDELLARLVRFEEAAYASWRVLDGELDETDLDALLADLSDLAPSANIGAGKLTELLLEDPVVREQVLTEMQEALADVDLRFEPQEPEGELRERIAETQAALIKRSDLVSLLLEDDELAAEAEEIEARLADQGVGALEPVERRELMQRRTAIAARRRALQNTWRNTPPAQPFASEYMDAQDALLRHRLAALGLRGALFAHRYDALTRRRADIDPQVPAHTWDFLVAQSDLSDAAAAAVPPPDPRAGLDLGDRVILDPATQAKQQQLINLLKKATGAGGGDSPLGPLPKPKKGKKKKPR